MKERAHPADAEPEAQVVPFDPLRHLARALGFGKVAAGGRR